MRLPVLALTVLLLSAGSASAAPGVFEGPVPRATCDRTSLPETGLQGQVPLKDRQSGRSTLGYRCNLELLGQYQGAGTSYVSPTYGTCVYQPQSFPTSLAGAHPGVQVVDVRDPRHPRLSTTLTSPAFLGNTWESLKVNEKRGLLAGTFAGPGEGVAFFDVYDVKTDCRHPRLLSSVSSTGLGLPSNTIGHEGQFAPDGRTYWSTSLGGGILTAIDIADPTTPTIAFLGGSGIIDHGLELSDDGNRLYLANVQPEGLVVLDVSSVQQRALVRQVTTVGTATWTDGSTGQHTIPVTWHGHRYLVFVDEGGAGAARILDVQDETHPFVVSKLKLEIHQAQHAAVRAADTAGTGAFGYEAHYCSADRKTDPRLLACGYFQSGIRVFDVRDPLRPKEVAYFNPPAQVGRTAQLLGSEHANGVAARKSQDPNLLNTDWCTSPPAFVGTDQLWVSCQDNGFLALRFTHSGSASRVATTKPRGTAPTSAPSASLASTGLPVGLPLLGLAGLSAAWLVRRRGDYRVFCR